MWSSKVQRHLQKVQHMALPFRLSRAKLLIFMFMSNFSAAPYCYLCVPLNVAGSLSQRQPVLLNPTEVMLLN